MELRHLRYFTVVAEEQNVTRAAARLHVSQPPLSRQIRDLEEELGVELFRRTAKSLALTEAGKIFLNEARAILLHVDQAVERLQVAAKGSQSKLRVGYAPSLTAELLPKALRELERQYPGTRVALHDFSTEQCLQGLKERRLDIALTVPPLKARKDGIIYEKLRSYPIFCAVAESHPLAQKKLLPLRLLRNEKFIIFSREDYPDYFDWLQFLFRPHGFVPKVEGEYDGVTGLITAVEAGHGVAIVTSSIQCMAGPRIKLLPLTPNPPPLTLCAAFIKPASKVTEAFVQILKEAKRESGL